MDSMCVACLATDKELYELQKPELDIFRYLLNESDSLEEDNFKFCNGCRNQLHSIREFQKKVQNSFNIIKLHNRQKQSSEENVGKIKVKEEFKVQEEVLNIKCEEITLEDNNIHCQPILIIEPLKTKTSAKPKIKKRLTRSRSRQLMKLRQHRKQTPVNTNNLSHSDEDNHLDDDKSDIVKSSQSKDDVDSEATLSASEKYDSDNEQIDRMAKKKVRFMIDPLKEANIEPLYPITTRGEEQEMQSWINCALTDREMRLYREKDIKDISYVTRPHKCADCIISFWDERPLIKHMNKMHSENAGPFQCSICKCRYANQKKLEICEISHKTMYKCMICKFVTRNFNRIKKHHAVEHSRIRYPCDLCETRFATYDFLVKHKLRKHKSNFICKCGEQFKTYSKYYMHKKKHLPQSEPTINPSKCQFCHKLYRTDDRLRAHVYNAHGSEPVYCVKCDVTFKSRHIYKAHFKYSMKHNIGEELKYQCDKCEKRFQTSVQFNSHYKSIHLRRGEHQCEQCPKKFAFKRTLKYHVRRVHGNYVKVKDKICDVCGKAFEHMKTLQSHMVTHTGERPYRCELCPSTFGFKAALYTHKKLVHEKVKRVWPKKKKKLTSDNVV